MSQSEGRVASHLNSPPTIDYNRRRPLFLRTTTWSLQDENSSENTVPHGPEKHTQKDMPEVELTLGDVEIRESFGQTRDMTETSMVKRASSSSVTPGFSTEDVIVKNIQVESSTIHVLREPVSNVAYPVTYSHRTHRAVSIDAGDCGETRKTRKFFTEGRKSASCKHGDKQKRGHSLTEMPTTSRWIMSIQQQPKNYQSSFFHRFMKHFERGERRSLKTSICTGPQPGLDKSDPVFVLPVEIKPANVVSRSVHELSSIRANLQSPSKNISSATEKQAVHPEDVLSTSTGLSIFTPPNHVKTVISSMDLSRPPETVFPNRIESRRATTSDEDLIDTGIGIPSVGGEKQGRTNICLSKATEAEEIYTCTPATDVVISKSRGEEPGEVRSCNKAVQTDRSVKLKRGTQMRTILSNMRSSTPTHRADRVRSPSPYSYQLYRCYYCCQIGEQTTRSTRSSSNRRVTDHSRRSRRFSLRTPASTSRQSLLSPDTANQRQNKRTVSRKARRKATKSHRDSVILWS